MSWLYYACKYYTEFIHFNHEVLGKSFLEYRIGNMNVGKFSKISFIQIIRSSVYPDNGYADIPDLITPWLLARRGLLLLLLNSRPMWNIMSSNPTILYTVHQIITVSLYYSSIPRASANNNNTQREKKSLFTSDILISSSKYTHKSVWSEWRSSIPLDLYTIRSDHWLAQIDG